MVENMRSKALGRLLIGLMILTAGCGQPFADSSNAPPARGLKVFAGASLTDAFTEIGKGFEAAHPGVKVVFNFGGSQTLRTQLEQGAVADVFASASRQEMDAAVAAGLVAEGAARVFARNRLVVIMPKANPSRIATLEDLGRPGLKIVLAADNVPVGGYSREALAKMAANFGADFKERVLASVVSNEDNVKQVVAKVQLGEADAGLVYSSDVTPAVAPEVMTLDIPDEFNVVAVYPMAPLAAPPHAGLASDFVRFVLSVPGQAILRTWGFIPVRT